MKRSFCLISIVALLAFSCQTHRSHKSLVGVDSLVVAELYDSAYQVLQTINQEDISDTASGLMPIEKPRCRG